MAEREASLALAGVGRSTFPWHRSPPSGATCPNLANEKRGKELAELGGTVEQQLIYLQTHWGRRYEFASAQAPGGKWAATARFDDRDRIQAPTSTELLEEVRAHYEARKPGETG